MRLRTHFVLQSTAGLAGGDALSQNEPKYKPELGLQDYVDRLITLIPGELIVSYPIISYVLSQVDNKSAAATFGFFLAMVITISLRTFGLRKEDRLQPIGVVISTLAAALWIYEQGGYFIWPVPKGYSAFPEAAAIAYSVIAPALSMKFIQGDAVIKK